MDEARFRRDLCGTFLSMNFIFQALGSHWGLIADRGLRYSDLRKIVLGGIENEIKAVK